MMERAGEDSPFVRRVETMGVEREVDWGLILTANWTIGHEVSLRRYPKHPEVKAAILAAREAMANLVNVYNREVSQPSWEAYRAEETT